MPIIIRHIPRDINHAGQTIAGFVNRVQTGSRCQAIRSICPINHHSPFRLSKTPPQLKPQLEKARTSDFDEAFFVLDLIPIPSLQNKK